MSLLASRMNIQDEQQPLSPSFEDFEMQGHQTWKRDNPCFPTIETIATWTFSSRRNRSVCWNPTFGWSTLRESNKWLELLPFRWLSHVEFSRSEISQPATFDDTGGVTNFQWRCHLYPINISIIFHLIFHLILHWSCVPVVSNIAWTIYPFIVNLEEKLYIPFISHHFCWGSFIWGDMVRLVTGGLQGERLLRPKGQGRGNMDGRIRSAGSIDV